MSVIKFPEKPDPVEELLDELNAVESERLLKEIEELIDEDKTGRMVSFIQFALRRYSARLVVKGEPKAYSDIFVDCASLILSKWWSPLSRRGDAVDAIYDEDEGQ